MKIRGPSRNHFVAATMNLLGRSCKKQKIIVHVPLQSAPYQFQLSEFAQPQTLNKAIFYGKFRKKKSPSSHPVLGGAAVEFVRVEPGETPWNPGHPHAMDLSNWYNQYKIKGVPSSLPLMMIRYPAIRQGVRPKISHTMLILKGLVICCCSLNENCHESCHQTGLKFTKRSKTNNDRDESRGSASERRISPMTSSLTAPGCLSCILNIATYACC